MENKTMYKLTTQIIQIIALFIGIIIPLALSGCAKTVPVNGRYNMIETQEKNISTSSPYTWTKGTLEILSFPFTDGVYYTLAAFEENIICGIMFTTVTAAVTAIGTVALPVSFTVDTIMLPHTLSQARQPLNDAE